MIRAGIIAACNPLFYLTTSFEKDIVMDAIIQKIKKLLALSESPNIHEAELAAQKAQEMLSAHNLTMQSVVNNPDAEELILENSYKITINRFTRILSYVVGESLDCRTILHKSINKKRESIQFFGYQQNPEIATYMFEYLYKASKTQWKRYLSELQNGPKPSLNGMSIDDVFDLLLSRPDKREYSATQLANKKKSYLEGFVRGIENKLKQQKARTPITPNALVPTMNALIQKRLDVVFGDSLKKSRSRVVYIDGAAYGNGIKDGFNTAISKGISNKSSFGDSVDMITA